MSLQNDLCDNQVDLIFSATQHNGWPNIKIYLDDDLYEDFAFTNSSATITLPMSLLDGDHELAVELYGKTSQNTQIVNGKIIADQTVTLEQIRINNVPIPDFIKYSGVHYYNGEEHAQSLVWGPNGIWKLHFKTPFIDWVLTEKEKINLQYQSTDTVLGGYNDAKKQKLMFYLKQIEELLLTND
jgi:hypothetical protein